MGFQLSAGVVTREFDFSGFIQNVATTGAAFVGQFEWGAVEEYINLNNKSQLEFKLGKPNDVNYRDWFSVSNFLDYSNNINVVRVVDDTVAKNATVDGTGLLIKNETSHSQIIGTSAGNTAIFASKYPSNLGNSLEIILIDSATWGTNPNYKSYENLFDGAPSSSEYVKSVNGSNDEIHVVIVDKLGLFTGIPDTVLERFAYLSKAKDGKELDGTPNFYGTVINNQSDYVWYLTDPESGDYAVGGSITNITVDNGGDGYTSVPNVVITGDGTLASATATLSSTGIIDSIIVTDGGTGYTLGDLIVIIGDGNGASAAVGSVTGGVIDTITVTNAGTGYSTANIDTTGSGNGDATATSTISKSVESVAVGSSGQNYITATTVITIDAPANGTQALASTVIVVDANFDDPWNTIASGQNFKSLSATFDKTLSGGINSATVGEDELTRGWDLFVNSEVVDVSLLIVGDAGEGATVNTFKTIVKYVNDNIATVRKDCVMFYSPKYSDIVGINDVNANANVINTRQDVNISSSYAFMDCNWKYQYDKYNDKYRWLPLNADVAGKCAYTDFNRDTWWSPAGYERGQIKNVVKLAYNPNKGQRDNLYKNGINPIISEVGEGVILLGDKTLLARPSAFQKLNIRRLFITLEKSIAKSAKYKLFEFNDRFTRQSFVSQVEPFLRTVQGRRGISDFKVVCDESNNTPQVIQNSEFICDIYIKPVYSINYIQLNFVAVGGNVEFSEVIGVLSENI